MALWDVEPWRHCVSLLTLFGCLSFRLSHRKQHEFSCQHSYSKTIRVMIKTLTRGKLSETIMARKGSRSEHNLLPCLLDKIRSCDAKIFYCWTILLVQKIISDSTAPTGAQMPWWQNNSEKYTNLLRELVDVCAHVCISPLFSVAYYFTQA